MTRTGARPEVDELHLLHQDATPCHRLPRLGRLLGIDLWVKRDDLYTGLAGGNKARKMERLLPTLERRGCDAIVTTGSSFSNHARAVALAAAQRSWPCTLVLHGDPADLSRTPNGRLLGASGAELRFVRPEQISSELSRAEDELRRSGRQPVVIEGGGHTLEGTLAYVDALYELEGQRRPSQAPGATVVVAPVGTGSTHAGLHVASEALGGYRVIGVSVARPRDRATAVADAACAVARSHLGHRHPRLPLEIYDEWTEGGYAITSPRLEATVQMVLMEEGLVLDPTYTGKTFLGLVQLVETGLITRGSEVWFLQTGGWSTLESAVAPPSAVSTSPYGADRSHPHA